MNRIDCHAARIDLKSEGNNLRCVRSVLKPHSIDSRVVQTHTKGLQFFQVNTLTLIFQTYSDMRKRLCGS